MDAKGISLISGLIFLALTIAATAIVYNAGVPVVHKLQAASAVEEMKGTMSELDKKIREVAAEGRGSKRTFTISSDPGKLVINGSADTVTWELDTSAPILSPRTSQKFGNLVIGSHLETSVREGNYTRVSPQAPAFIIENDHLLVYISRSGSPTSRVQMETKTIVLGIFNKDLNAWLDNPGFLDISVDGNANSRSGQGYTKAVELGSNLPFGAVIANLDTSYIDYEVQFRLETGADFLTLEATEV